MELILMKYNPDKHHWRSIRLQEYDYTSAGMYFITICTDQRQCLFGEIAGNIVKLSAMGEIAERCWQAIPNHFPAVHLDRFVIMPNHLHGILVIADICEDTAAECPKREFGRPIAGSVSTIVGSFKPATTKRINILRNTPGTPVWQRNFYEHIIRSEKSLQFIRQYIQNNPLSRQQDQLHPNHLPQPPIP